MLVLAQPITHPVGLGKHEHGWPLELLCPERLVLDDSPKCPVARALGVERSGNSGRAPRDAAPQCGIRSRCSSRARPTYLPYSASSVATSAGPS